MEVSGGDDYIISIWDLSSGNLKNKLQGHTDVVSSLVLLGNGNLASASWDKTVKIWSMKDGSLIQTLAHHDDIIPTLILLDSGYLASGGIDAKINLWDCN